MQTESIDEWWMMYQFERIIWFVLFQIVGAFEINDDTISNKQYSFIAIYHEP